MGKGKREMLAMLEVLVVGFRWRRPRFVGVGGVLTFLLEQMVDFTGTLTLMR